MKPSYAKLVESVILPPMALVRQHFETEDAGDPVAAVEVALAQAAVVSDSIRPGMSVALTVGSRRLASLPELVKAIVDGLRARGARPFIVPSMGNHGGATAGGQVSVLAHLGVTEESIGCEIRSSMETGEVGVLDNGMSVQVDRLAFEADGIVLFNRIKPHGAFRSDNESGLVKCSPSGWASSRAQTIATPGVSITSGVSSSKWRA